MLETVVVLVNVTVDGCAVVVTVEVIVELAPTVMVEVAVMVLVVDGTVVNAIEVVVVVVSVVRVVVVDVVVVVKPVLMTVPHDRAVARAKRRARMGPDANEEVDVVAAILSGKARMTPPRFWNTTPFVVLSPIWLVTRLSVNITFVCQLT